MEKYLFEMCRGLGLKPDTVLRGAPGKRAFGHGPSVRMLGRGAVLEAPPSFGLL